MITGPVCDKHTLRAYAVLVALYYYPRPNPYTITSFLFVRLCARVHYLLRIIIIIVLLFATPFVFSLEPLKGYQGEDIEIQLPKSLTVYSIDWLAVWCVQHTHNFGHVNIPDDLDVPPALGQTVITVSSPAGGGTLPKPTGMPGYFSFFHRFFPELDSGYGPITAIGRQASPYRGPDYPEYSRRGVSPTPRNYSRRYYT